MGLGPGNRGAEPGHDSWFRGAGSWECWRFWPSPATYSCARFRQNLVLFFALPVVLFLARKFVKSGAIFCASSSAFSGAKFLQIWCSIRAASRRQPPARQGLAQSPKCPKFVLEHWPNIGLISATLAQEVHISNVCLPESDFGVRNIDPNMAPKWT